MDGRKYSVNSGLQVAFAQYVASVTISELPNASAPTNAHSTNNTSNNIGTTTSAANKPDIKTENNISLKYTGDLHMFGSITRKLVITPEYEIGNDSIRKSNYQYNNNNSSSSINELGIDMDMNENDIRVDDPYEMED